MFLFVAGSKSTVHYYKSENPCDCVYFMYFGYNEETPSNSHLYLCSKQRKQKQQTAANDDDDDDDDVSGGDDAAGGDDGGGDTCGDAEGSGLADLYDPCTSGTLTGNFCYRKFIFARQTQ